MSATGACAAARRPQPMTANRHVTSQPVGPTPRLASRRRPVIRRRATAVARRRMTGRRRDASRGVGPTGWLVTWRFAVIGWGRRAAAQAPVADIYHGHDLSGAVAAERATAL